MVEILLDGVDESRRELALRDLEDVLSHASGLEPLIDKIIVAKDFRGVVRSYGGPADYESVHEYGYAVAKTLSTRKNNELRFTIVVNGETCRSWDDCMILDRHRTIWHELTHISDDAQRADAIGLDAFFSEPSNKKQVFLKSAWSIWVEYHAERVFAESISKVIARKPDLKYDFFAETKEYVRRLGELIDDLRNYLNANATSALKREVEFEEAVGRVTSRLTGILFLTAYVRSKADLDARLKASVLELKKKQNYLRFLSQDLDSIAGLLDKLFAHSGEYREDLLDRMGIPLDSIFRRCGVTIRDLNGKYLINLRPV